jgi:hypothetical protein
MIKPRMPSDTAVDIAVEWLLCNEGEGAEGDACKEVAAWLLHEQRERLIRAISHETGVTPARVRRKLTETMKLRKLTELMKSLTNRTKCPRS